MSRNGSGNGKKLKYIIVSPHGRAGGTIVLHLLCQGIRKQGYDCRIFYPAAIRMSGDSEAYFWLKHFGNKFKGLFRSHKNDDPTPVGGCKECKFPRAGQDTIVVYPERFCGNILHAKNVVRWFLNIPSEDMIATYGKDEFSFAFRKVFNVEKLNPEGRLLNLYGFDQETFRQTNFGKREGGGGGMLYPS